MLKPTWPILSKIRVLNIPISISIWRYVDHQCNRNHVQIYELIDKQVDLRKDYYHYYLFCQKDRQIHEK